MTQVRQQNTENQRKQNKERAVRKLLKKITTEKPSDKAVQEVRSLFIRGFLVSATHFANIMSCVFLFGNTEGLVSSVASKQPVKVVSSGVITYVSLYLWNANPLSICKQSSQVTL